MKSPNTKDVAIQQVNTESLAARISEWSNRIAKRAYEFFAGSGFTDGHDLEDWFNAEQELLQQVAVEVKDSGDEFQVKARVSGFDAKDLDIRLCGSRLMIEGKHETMKGNAEKDPFTGDREQETREIYRMIELPAPILAEGVRAELRNDLLEIYLPRAEKAAPIQIIAA